MSLYAIGRLIRIAREKANLSQQELCEGICSLSTLSKIENGIQNPTRETLKNLSERLGLDLGLFNIPVSDREAHRQAIEQEISLQIADGKDEYSDLLLEYAQLGINTNIEKQLYQFADTLLRLHTNLPESIALDEFLQAIHLTNPEFNPENPLKQFAFSHTEQLLLHQIAQLFFKTGQEEKAFQIYFDLKSFYDKEEYNELKEKLYPPILYNLSTIVGRKHDYALMVDLCTQSIDYCKERGRLRLFPYFLFNKGYGLAQLGKHADAQIYLGWAFPLFEALDKSEQAAWLSEECNKKFGYHFPVQVQLAPDRRKLFVVDDEP